MNILTSINNQREYFNSGQSRDVKFRIQQLKRLKVVFEKYEDECILALGKDLGKSQTEAYLTEIVLIRDELKMAIRNTKKWSKSKRVPTPIILAVASSYRQPEPYGVTLIVSPWNYPIALGLMPLIGAISAGNTAVVKPSELAPASSVIITKIISECFRPEHVISIEGGVEVAMCGGSPNKCSSTIHHVLDYFLTKHVGNFRNFSSIIQHPPTLLGDPPHIATSPVLSHPQDSDHCLAQS